MRAGTLRHRLAYQEPPALAADDRNDSNEPGLVPATVATVWGKLEPLSGEELFHARQVVPEVSHRVTVRYPVGFTVSPRGRWAYADPGIGVTRYFNVVSSWSPEERRDELVCLCKEQPAEAGA